MNKYFKETDVVKKVSHVYDYREEVFGGNHCREKYLVEIIVVKKYLGGNICREKVFGKSDKLI